MKISKDGGAIANIGTLPAVITSSAAWEFTLAAAEMRAREIFIQVIDSATKAVDDQSFILRTRPTLSSGQLSSQTGAAAGEVYVPDAAITANDQYIGAYYYEYNSSGVLVGHGVITDSVEDTQDKLVLNGGTALWWTPTSGNYFTIEPFGVSGVTEAQLAAAVLNATAASYNSAGTIGEKINSAGSGASAADIADAVWDEATSGHTTAGTFGERATRIPNAAAGANGGLPTVDANNAVKVQSGTGANQISLSSGLVTVGTNNDKTGYTASTVTDKTGYSLSAAGVLAIWDALTSALTTVGSVGKRIADFLTGDAYVRLGAPAGASIAADIAAAKSDTAAAKAVTDKLDTAVELDGAVYRFTANALEQAPTGGSAPTVEQIRIEIDDNSTQLAAIVAAIAALNNLSSAQVGDAVLDEVVEGSYTLRQLIRLISSVMLAKSTGMASTAPTFRDLGDTKNRVVVTLDGDDRTAVVLDAT